MAQRLDRWKVNIRCILVLIFAPDFFVYVMAQRLDRWKVNISVGGGEPFEKEYLMCNYFSIGWDAMIAR